MTVSPREPYNDAPSTWQALSASSESEFPATAFQSHVYREIQRSGDHSAYNVAVRYRFQGSVNDASVQRALQALGRRHEILRTYLVERDGEVRQCVLAALSLPLHVENLEHLPVPERARALERLGRAEARAIVEHRAVPLVRLLLVRLDAQDAVLHLTFHQLGIDGWSLSILMRELGTLAAAYDAGTAFVLPQVELHYGDYARWQQDALDSGAFAEDLEYWRVRLAGVPQFSVAPDRLSAAADGGGSTPAESEILSRLLPPDVGALLEARAHARGHTLFTLGFAALAAALQRTTAETQVVMSTQVAGREQVALESVVGPLINTLVLHLDVQDHHTLTELTDQARAERDDALAHQALPYEALLSELAGDPDYAGARTRVNFILQKAYISEAQVSDSQYGKFKLLSMPSYPSGALWDLNFFMVGRDEGWRLSCEADPERYSRGFVERLLALWNTLLITAAAAPDLRVAELPRLCDVTASTGTDERGTNSREPTGIYRRPPVRSRAATNLRLRALEERILPLRETGAETPVLIANNMAVLGPLAEALGPERPVYDLQLCPSDEPLDLPVRHFGDLAKDVVEMVRLCRPHGPYILGGLCVFGALSLEAARQLRAEGEHVELVMLNDSWRPGYREDMPWTDRKERALRVRAHNVWIDTGRVQRGEATASEILAGMSSLKRLGLVQLGLHLGLLQANVDQSILRLENRWFTDYLLRIQSGFRPEPYPGEVVVMRSREPMTGRLFAHDLGWGPYVSGQLHVVDCPGMHSEMYRPAGSRAMADAIRTFARGETNKAGEGRPDARGSRDSR